MSPMVLKINFYSFLYYSFWCITDLSVNFCLIILVDDRLHALNFQNFHCIPLTTEFHRIDVHTDK